MCNSVTPWTIAHQAPLSMGFSRQEYWSCHFLLRGIFCTQGSNTCLLCLLRWLVDSLPPRHLGIPGWGGDPYAKAWPWPRGQGVDISTRQGVRPRAASLLGSPLLHPCSSLGIFLRISRITQHHPKLQRLELQVSEGETEAWRQVEGSP